MLHGSLQTGAGKAQKTHEAQQVSSPLLTRQSGEVRSDEENCILPSAIPDEFNTVLDANLGLRIQTK
jgi:hypothetical protein